MKKRTIVSGLVVIGIAIGAFLGNFFPDMGSGESETLVEVPVDPEFSESAEVEIEVGEVLDVLLEDHNYLVRTGLVEDAEYRQIELAKLVELAKKTTGNTDGIRVRVTRRESARATSEIRLKEAIAGAGLSEESLFWDKNITE